MKKIYLRKKEKVMATNTKGSCRIVGEIDSAKLKNRCRHFIITSCTGILINVCVILLMLRKRNLLKRSSNKILLNLLISECVVCISFTAASTNFLVHVEESKTVDEMYILQRSFAVVTAIVLCLSLLNLILLTLDRLIAIKWPLIYSDRITKKHIYFSIVLIWVISSLYDVVVIAVYCTLDPENILQIANTGVVVTVILGFLILVISNSFIFVEAKKQMNTLKKISRNFLENDSLGRKKFNKLENQIIYRNVGIAICFILFWINAVITDILCLLDAEININYMITAFYLVHVYYLLEPFWYVGMSHDVKKEIKKIFKHFKPKENNRNNANTPLRNT